MSSRPKWGVKYPLKEVKCLNIVKNKNRHFPVRLLIAIFSYHKRSVTIATAINKVGFLHINMLKRFF